MSTTVVQSQGRGKSSHISQVVRGSGDLIDLFESKLVTSEELLFQSPFKYG